MKESWAFFSKTADTLKGKEVLIDVCGGHGLIAMLFLAFRKVGGLSCLRLPLFRAEALYRLPRRLHTAPPSPSPHTWQELLS